MKPPRILSTLAFCAALIACAMPAAAQVYTKLYGITDDAVTKTGVTLRLKTREVTAAYTVTATNDHTILANATAGAFSITFPAAGTNLATKEIVVQKTDVTTNAVTLVFNSTEKADGQSSIVLSSQFASVTLQAGFGSWHIKGGNVKAGDVVIASDSTGGNLGAKNTVTGIINSKLIPFATLTDGTASVKTKALMDDTPAGEWSAIGGGTADPTPANSATYARVGTNSLKLPFLATAVAGDGAKFTAFSGENWEAQESVGMWVYSTVALTAGDVVLKTVDSTGDVSFNMPAVATANKWTWVEFDISGLAAGTGDAVTNIKIALSTAGAALGAFDLYLDGAYKWDATEELALGVDLVDSPGAVRSVLYLTKANTGTHDMALLAEGTDFFVHSESGNDFLVTISNQAANAAFALVNHKE